MNIYLQEELLNDVSKILITQNLKKVGIYDVMWCRIGN